MMQKSSLTECGVSSEENRKVDVLLVFLSVSLMDMNIIFAFAKMHF